MKVNILDIDIEVVTIDSSGRSDPNMGCADYKEGKIILNAGMPESVRHNTLVHEMIHIISDILDLGIKESQVSGLACGLAKFIKMPYNAPD